MHFAKTTFALGLLVAATAIPSFAQQATTPDGSFVDSFGTSFTFKLCGESGTDLCGVLTNLEGKSATPGNLEFVGKQVMQATQSAPNTWTGSITAGEMSADATITQIGPDTIEIQGCRVVVLCQTLAYNRA